MSRNALIIGESGTGKSTSIRNLDPKETFIINVLNKPLPFKGWKNSYRKMDKSGTGNMFITDNADLIVRTMDWISKDRPDIKTIVIDDFQYVMANQFMRQHSNAGKGNAVFSLYNDIGDKSWNIFMRSSELRDDLIIIMLSHSEEDERGKTKFKTIGRMLDEKVKVEGMFTIVLETVIEDKQYKFLTRNNGHNTAKTPMGMFEDELIDNDLRLLITSIKEYDT